MRLVQGGERAGWVQAFSIIFFSSSFSSSSSLLTCT